MAPARGFPPQRSSSGPRWGLPAGIHAWRPGPACRRRPRLPPRVALAGSQPGEWHWHWNPGTLMGSGCPTWQLDPCTTTCPQLSLKLPLGLDQELEKTACEALDGLCAP